MPDSLPRPLPPSRLAWLEERVRQALMLRWLDCLHGWVPPGLQAGYDLADPALRALRNSPRFCFMLRGDRIDRFWHREYSFVMLRCAVLLRSAWSGSPSRPIRHAELAKESGLSDRTVGLTLRHAIATGDLLPQPGLPGDRRLRLEPSSRFIAEVNELHRGYVAAIAGFLGRHDPQARLDADGWRVTRRLVMLAMLTAASHRPGGAPLALRRSFIYLLLDLLVDGPRPARGAPAEFADRLQVTDMTVRNVITRARQEGWLEPSDTMLVPSAQARHRFSLAFATMQRRWHALQDVIDVLAEEPGLADALERVLPDATLPGGRAASDRRDPGRPGLQVIV